MYEAYVGNLSPSVSAILISVTRDGELKEYEVQLRDKYRGSLVTRKPVFGVCHQVRLELACAATEARYRLEILNIETRGIILSRQRTTKALIRLHGCAG